MCGVQAAEDAIMADMAEVKAGMERRQKREKRKKMEQKKKARVRAAQAVLGESTPAVLCVRLLDSRRGFTSKGNS